jgi:7,8-dihydropterin-6-yl-methyl-4-(beta-D-ribofuranosyl)aminobenzene 5'-phosphate synthase
MRRALLVVLCSLFVPRALAQAPTRVQKLKITVLSTMLADQGLGEWGFAALVEADGRRWLFDTGARPDTVLQNLRELKIDLSDVSDVILSHNHGDHTRGLLTLRREWAKTNPRALSRVHVGEGIFASRPQASGEANYVLGIKKEYEATGGTFAAHAQPEPLAPGVWLTGPVRRVHPERNWSTRGQVQTAAGLVEDTIPEDMSLVFDTEQGLVLLSGCGHAGIINTIEQARGAVRAAPLHAAIGGFHLFAASEETLGWTAGKLREFGLANLIGAHCTGIEAVYRLRQLTGLDRKTAVVGAVGASFTLGKGIDPLDVAK